MRAILLSAGFGKRLRPYTENKAKPAIPFLGLPMVAYSLFLAEKAGVTDVILNTHHQPESLHQAVETLHSSLAIEFIHESPEILDSGGGIKNAQSFLSQDAGDFWVLNGDTVVLLSDLSVLKRALERHHQKKAIATVFVCPSDHRKS